MSAAKPESAAAAHASSGAGDAAGGDEDIERRVRRERRDCFFFVVACRFSASSAISAFDVTVRDWSHHAPAAAMTFSRTPTHVVARRPMAGIRKKPAAMAPAAAPAVFTAYSTPVSAAFRAYQSAAIGNVAPIAAAGTPSSARLIATRTSANCAGALPSAYAHASSGTDAASAAGKSSAHIATMISRTA